MQHNQAPHRPGNGRWRRPLAVLTGVSLAVCSLLATAGTSHAGTAAGAFISMRTPAATTVELPAGQHVQVSTEPDGRQAALVLPGSDGAADAGYLTLQLAGDLYVIPRSALPDLAKGASLSRFDVTALAAHRAPSAGQHQARYPLRTMRITGIDELGQPAAGLTMFYLIINVDNGNKFAYFNSMATGYRNMAVPVGHYAVFGFFSRQDKATGAFDDRIVTVPEINITPSPGITNVTLDARTATDTLNVTTPRPAVRQIQDVQVDRSDAAATGDISLGYELIGARDTISVNPTRPHAVKHGQLHFYTTWRLAADDGSYTYDLEYPADGYVPDIATYTANQSQLATINARYDANVTGTQGLEMRYSFLPWQTAAIRVGSSALRPPAQRTEYVLASPRISWLQQIEAIFNIITDAGGVSDSYRTYRPGQQLTEQWNTPPIVPGVQADFGASPGAFDCTACREGNTLRLLIYPFGDNQLGHVGARDGVRPGSQIKEATDFAIYNGDTQLADTSQALGSIDLPAEPGTYHLVYDNTRTAPWWTLSTSVRTEWTFNSSASDGTGRLPHGWECGPDGGTDCGIVPLLFARYSLPADDLGGITQGQNTLQFTVAHAQGAASSPVDASMDVSYDGGTTWTPAQLTSAGDRFTANIDVPDTAQTDGYLAIRLHAADQNGSMLDQTVLRAAAIGTSAPPAVTQADLGQPDTTASPASDVTPACDDGGPGRAKCFALVRAQAIRANTTSPAGYGPADLQSAYRIADAAAQRGSGQTIAIVDAYNAPTAEADLATYRQQFGLPPCTTDNGCFTKLNQRGGTDKYPRADFGWGTEIALDLDMVSAACPQCRIVLVEADSNSVSDLAVSEDTAAAAGANVISNSYGTDEFTGMDAYLQHYRHPGVFVTAASGDFGFTFPQFPAVMPDVAAVGGTTLRPAASQRGWTETAWGNGPNSGLGGGAGSGCSGYVRKPAWQTDRDCLMRTTADVSADADPATGVAVYDTTAGQRGWIVVGGTSAAAPFIAGVIGLAGNAATLTTAAIYQHSADLFDVAGGSAGYCDSSYICTGTDGFDGPTGLGTPNGTGGF